MHKRTPSPVVHKTITLIGMPSAGKSKIGRALADILAYDFVDTDEVIVSRYCAANLQKVVDKLSPQEFKQAEESAAIETLTGLLVPTIIATGGSMVYSELAMSRLHSETHVVHLWATLATVTQRVAKHPDRGLVLDPGETLADLYMRRMPLYSRWAHRVVDTNQGRRKAAKRLAKDLVAEAATTPVPAPSPSS